MAIQIGTVDGLFNISKDKIRILINAIKAFDNECISKAYKLNISLGTAFQRFVEPVYRDPSLDFDINSISINALTRSGKEQSPARLTYCKKMGLLDINDSSGIFQLTPLGEALYYNRIEVSDYALILLSKMGVFRDDLYVENLLVFLSGYYQNNSVANENLLKDYVISSYGESELIKTRFDIILGALFAAGLLYKVDNEGYLLKDIYSARIFNAFIDNKNKLGVALLDNSPNYSKYIGSLENGVFNVIDKQNEIYFKKKYPNIFKFFKLENNYLSFHLSYENHSQFLKNPFIDYLRAMRTKPFLLLAGISGTGKSRIVKQMAFDSCPDKSDLQSDPTSPGNYCLIEVKPNWHDSTELLGYESKIGVDHYVLTPFVKFLTKAMLYPEVPFFVCLDEMNLAPVEQYFAEFLSVLESRTKIDGHIVSEPLIKADIFSNKDYILKLQDELFGLELKEEITEDKRQRIISGQLSEENQKVYDILQEQGLRIPENVVIIGTVNMDETTHQFSRKVIDRAMTIEMNLPEGEDAEGNGINPFKAFFDNSSDLSYRNEPTSLSLYLATETKASNVIDELAENDAEKTDWLKERVAEFLTALNANLDGTPFKVAYRVQNELLLYFYQLWLENNDEDWENILATSADQILMMKVLPRIEGDEELLEKPLERLISFCEPYPSASKKLLEMQTRLKQSRFASFWP